MSHPRAVPQGAPATGAEPAAPSLLCFARIPPHPEGTGGSQRAWFLVEALGRLGRVHLVLLYPQSDDAVARVPLDRVAACVESVTVIPVPEWNSATTRLPLPWSVSALVDLLRLGSMDAPRLGRGALRRIAASLPPGPFDVVVAVRPSSAVIAGRLRARGLLRAGRWIADLDDILSRFRRRQVASRPQGMGRAWRWLMLRDAAALERAETAICAGWDAVSLCSDEDIAALRRATGRNVIAKVPNVVDRPLLPLVPHSGIRLLFVGNLRFEPNRQGLLVFLRDAWPDIHRRGIDVTLVVVGLSPPPDIVEALDGPRMELHGDAPTVEPFYAGCDIVLSPITFGTGTRIKIIEAMAFGRPVVATPLAAEGLGLRDEHHALLATTMPAFAEAVLRLAGDPVLRAGIAARARAHQQRMFGPAAIAQAVESLLEPGAGDAMPRA